MKKDVIARIQKFGRISHRITKIALGISIALELLLLVLAVGLSLGPKELVTFTADSRAEVSVDLRKINGETAAEEVMGWQERADQILRTGMESLTLFGNEYEVEEIHAEQGVLQLMGVSKQEPMNFHSFSYALFATAIWMAVELVILWIFKGICGQLAVCETPFAEGIIQDLRKLNVTLILWVLLSAVTDSLILSFITGNVKLELDIDFLQIIAVLLVVLLTHVFHYGAMLQQESDETL